MEKKRKEADRGGTSATKRIKGIKDSCKSCNGSGHKSILNKECPNHIPVEQRPRTLTIPVSALGRYNYPRFIEVIEYACDTASKIVCRAMWLSHCYYVYVLENGLHFEPFNGTFFRHCVSLVSSTGALLRTEVDPVLHEVYDDVFGNTTKIDSIGLGNVLAYAVNNIVTVANNFDTEALDDHVAMYLRAKYNIRRGHASGLASKVCGETPKFYQTLPKTLEGTVDQWNQVIAHENALYTGFCGEANGIGTLHYRFHMSNTILQSESRHNEEFRRFAMLPIVSEGRQFIQLDNKGLRLLQAYAKKLFTKKELAVPGVINELEDAFQSVDGFFDLEDLKRKNQKMDLCPTLKTNGIELHVMFETKNTRRYASGRRMPLRLEEKIKPWHLDPSYNFDDITGVAPGEVSSVDPGNSNVYTAVRLSGSDKDGTPIFEKRSMSKAEYVFLSKRDKVVKKAANVQSMHKLDEIYRLFSMTTFKSPRYCDVKKATRMRLEYHHFIHHKLTNRQLMKLKFEKRRAEKRLIDRLIKFLTFDYQVNVLVFGDCDRLSGLRGTTVGAPNCRIMRHARKVGRQMGFEVKQVNEAYTSKRSWYVKGEDTKPMKDGNNRFIGKDDKWHRPSIHGLLICQGSNKVWSRDVNGAINIFYVAMAKINNQDRPWWLRRAIARPLSSTSQENRGVI